MVQKEVMGRKKAMCQPKKRVVRKAAKNETPKLVRMEAQQRPVQKL